jgi:hypothetical protein
MTRHFVILQRSSDYFCYMAPTVVKVVINSCRVVIHSAFRSLTYTFCLGSLHTESEDRASLCHVDSVRLKPVRATLLSENGHKRTDSASLTHRFSFFNSALVQPVLHSTESSRDKIEHTSISFFSGTTPKLLGLKTLILDP